MRRLGDRERSSARVFLEFSKIPRRSLPGRLLRAPLGAIPKGWALPILQGPAGGMRWVVGAGSHGFWLGSYEAAKAVEFAARVPPGATVIDAGAHAGYYTLIGSRRVGPNGRVIAIEPDPRNAELLRRHIALNALRNVKVLEAALSDSEGEAGFQPGPEPSLGHLSRNGTLRVRTLPLDSLAGDLGPGPVVVKVDVEGAEAQLLQGAKQMMLTRRPVLFLSTHGCDVHQACLRLLAEWGYCTSSLDGRPPEDSSELLCEPGPEAAPQPGSESRRTKDDYGSPCGS